MGRVQFVAMCVCDMATHSTTGAVLVQPGLLGAVVLLKRMDSTHGKFVVGKGRHGLDVYLIIFDAPPVAVVQELAREAVGLVSVLQHQMVHESAGSFGDV